jgi:hypothetical protein
LFEVDGDRACRISGVVQVAPRVMLTCA